MSAELLSPQRSAEFARRYRNSAFMLGIAVLLLAATAVYLVVKERNQVWATAHRNQQDVAMAMQASISEALGGPIFSIQGIGADLSARRSISRAEALEALRLAMRFDPLSTYLGIKTSKGLMLVDAAGEVTLGRDGEDALPGVGLALPPGGLRLNPMFKLGNDSTWYLPVVIPAPASLGAEGVVFALVPATRLLGGASSLRVLPGSFVTLFTPDGVRLLRYLTESGVLEANGKPIPPVVLQICARAANGNFARASTVDGRPSLFGYSNSASLPLIVSTGVADSALQAQWLSNAIAPFVVLTAGVLAIVVFGLRLRRALLEQRDYVARQEYMASHDSLTDLPNRYAFITYVDGLIERAQHDTGFHVLLLDLNNFKDVNDTLGHAAGDAVLEAIGLRLKTLLANRPGCVARLGGDEIALCVPALARLATSEPGGAVIAFCHDIQRVLNTPLIIQGVELAVTASIGVAAYPKDAGSSTELLRCADIAMYSAKEDLSPHCEYLETMDHFTADALAMRAEFAKAIREDTLTLVYQPKLRLSDLALVGLEALSRWTHPTKGPIPPLRFLPLAETTELIHPFTELVLKNAIAQIARWLAQGHAVPVAVNISANNLLEHRFADKLRERLAESAVPPHLLELEVTESAVMRHPEAMLKRLQDIRNIGVKLSIDDFGTGYASLAYLKRLPVDSLKIDKLFITHIDSDPRDKLIVRSSIQLAHGFGMKVVAEGAETQISVDILKEAGCDDVQGFHFSKPISAAEIEAHWLSRLAKVAKAPKQERVPEPGLELARQSIAAD